jgi:hypothetical protein
MKIRKIGFVSIISMMMLLGIAIIPSGSSDPIADTELEIISVSGGFAQVTVEVKNIGNETTDGLQLAIEVKGGILDRIDLLHLCGGCSSCVPLEPDAIKTESTMEAGLIFGVGPISILTSASAVNAPEVTLDSTGFVIGPFVIIQ